MPPVPPRPARRRPRRRLLVALGIAGAGLALLAACLPPLIGTRFARDRILARINADLAPGRLTVDRFEASWTGPMRLVGCALFAPGGNRVLDAPAARLDRSLGQLLIAGGRPAVLDLGPADLRVERRVDGTLDLAEALRGAIAHPDPAHDRTIRIRRGTLAVRPGGAFDPIVARGVDLDLHIPPAPGPTTWDLKLVHPDGGDLAIRGDTNRWTAPDADPGRADLQVDVAARRWPIRHRAGAVAGQGSLDGTIAVARRSGRWAVDAGAQLLDVALAGPALLGDTLRPGPVTLRCDARQDPAGWSVRRLTLESDVGSLRGEGPLDDPGRDRSRDVARRVEGRLDLAALARQLPHALRLRPGLTVEGGRAELVAELTGPLDRPAFALTATLADLAARDGARILRLRDPATLSARLVRANDTLRIEHLAAAAAFGRLEATGRLDDARLAGSVDLGALRRQLAEWVDLGPIEASGRVAIDGTYKVADRLYRADLQLRGEDLHLAGTPAGPVDRPLATLMARASGPPGPSGRPEGWDTAELAAVAGDSEARVEVRRAGDLLAVGGRIVAAWPGAAGDRRVEATVAGAWDEGRRVLRCDRVAAHLLVREGDRPLFAASGQVDPGAGTAQFDAIDGPGAATAPVRLGPGGIRASGLGRELAAVRIDVGLAGELAGPGDRWSAVVHAQGEDRGLRLAADGRVEPAAGRPGGGDLATFRLAGRYDRAADRVELDECRAASPYGELAASGQLDDLAGARRFDLRGRVAPDFAALTAWLRDRVEPGARVAGQAGKFRAGGAWSGPEPLRSVDGEVGFDLAGADVYGIQLGPTPIILRARGGEVRVDPIGTTLNEGHVRLEPEILMADSRGEPVLRLGKNSTIRDARINDEVSRRVLAFVAPILEGTTRASGLVSVDLDRAEIPLGPGRARAAQVDGSVVFADVAFAPGPLAADLLGAIGRREATLRLDRPVTLTIADGRVNQSGLAIPLGDLTRVELAGWVDFDRNLDLTASLPVTPALLGNNPLLTDIAAGTQVRLPVTGTLDHPRVDRDALAAGLKDLGRSLLTRGATRGALELLNRLGRPRDPAAPPPPTAAERKAARRERKAERRAGRDAPPGP